MYSKITNKLKQKGFLYVANRIYLKIVNLILLGTGLYAYVVFKTRWVKIKYRNTNVSKVLFEIRDLHDQEVLEMKNLIKAQNPVIIDIGANIGTISLPLATFFPKGLIYSIEASPYIFTVLYENILLNNLKNIIPISAAVSSGFGFVYFSKKQADDISVINTGRRDQETISVLSISLDKIFSDVKKIDLIKIDVEGYELFILKNSIETLKKTRVIHCEYFEKNTQNFGYKREEIKNFLETLGFECYVPNLEKYTIKVENLIAINKNI